MAGPRREIAGSPPRHSCAGRRRTCLYELALGQAIATQHGLGDAGRSDLSACEECGAPYLLQEVWQPLSEEGELACPRCGAIVAAWEGARTFVAYWYRDVRNNGPR
jgi:hypothetical protein